MNREGNEGFCGIAHSLNIVNIFLQPSSSSRSTAPIESIDIDNKIASPISSLFKCIDDKLISMSKDLFSKISDLGQFKLEITNASFAVEPKVSGITPGEASLHPCTTLPELLFNPACFRVLLKARCLQVWAMPTYQTYVLS